MPVVGLVSRRALREPCSRLGCPMGYESARVFLNVPELLRYFCHFTEDLVQDRGHLLDLNPREGQRWHEAQ